MLNFKLEDEFVNPYRSKPEPFGFNGLGKVVYHRTYSRTKEDGTQETWVDTCRRVIEGMYSLLMDHCNENNRPWSDEKARRSAREAFDRLFNLKWSPSGRGLWLMGTPFIHERKVPESLQNCAFITTENIAEQKGYVFNWFMEMLMLGVGVGSDTRGAGKIRVYKPREESWTFVIPDTREGWSDSTDLLITSYLKPYSETVTFDYSNIRSAGEPIKGFGGISSGADPLIKLHSRIREFLTNNSGELLTSRTIVDIFNAIGACVIAGNVRRSAEIMFGNPEDSDFLELKNYDKNPERTEYGWSSNNSILAKLGMDYSNAAENILNNGEPGFIWLENANTNAQMGVYDTSDKSIGSNPCGEILLYDREFCNLVELYPTRNKDLYDFARSIKFAYLYGKAVTLLSKHIKDETSRQNMVNNRRIGLSTTGIAQFVAENGIDKLKEWLTYGAQEVDRYDRVYSRWLEINESIRKRTVKPSGTVSLLAGVTPGVHYPESQYYIRRVRIASDTDLEKNLVAAGYPTEKDLYSDNTTVVEFPICIASKIRSVKDVSMWEQLELAAFMQEHWSDNSVSVTITFDPGKTSKSEVVSALDFYQYRLKSVSMLPTIDGGAYEQMPYEEITKEEYEKRSAVLGEIHLNALEFNNTMDDKYCDSQTCEIQYNQ